MHRDGLSIRRWNLALLALTAVLLFLLLHPYRGLYHDARLYTLQALGHWQPELYGADIFLRLGSQDDYTLFSSLHAMAISWLGVESAAAALTGASVLLFLTGFVLLARTCMSSQQAAIAVILLLVIPGYYGSGRIFHHMENFVSPRQLAEALTLFSLAFWSRGSRLPALGIAIGAMLIHPIIGLAGLLMLPVLEWILPHWRRLAPLAVCAAVLCGLIVGLSQTGWSPLTRWQFDPVWYELVMKRTYLGMANWTHEDWARVVTVFATLGASSILLDGLARRLAVATALTVAALMLLALLGETMRIALVLQAQPWRAMWLGTVIAILLLVPLFVRGWRMGRMTQCALLLIAAAWAGPHGTLALISAPLAVVACLTAARSIALSTVTLLWWASAAILTMAVTHGLAVTWLAWNEDLTVHPVLHPLLQKITLLGDNGVLPALVVAAAAGFVLRLRSAAVSKAMTGLVFLGVLALAYPVGRTWASTSYDDRLFNSFSEWRERIPPGTEVLWVETQLETAAVNTWLLLQRPAYISSTQAPNALFSRAAAIEMARRADAVSALLPFTNPFRPEESPRHRTSYSLAEICASLDVRFIVTSLDMTDAVALPAPADAPPTLRENGLYTCP